MTSKKRSNSDGIIHSFRYANLPPVPSPSEQIELAKKIHDQNDSAARDRMILGNMRLVFKLAKKYRDIGAEIGIEYADFVQGGSLALTRAVDAYNYRSGNQFTTYATASIKGTFRTMVNEKGAVRIPHGTAELGHKLASAIQISFHQTGRSAEMKEVAQSLRFSDDEFLRAVDSYVQATSFGSMGLITNPNFHFSARNMKSLSSAMSTSSIVDAYTARPDEIVHSRQFKVVLDAVFSRMDGRDAQVVRMRKELAGDGQVYQHNEIGEIIGVGRTRVQQLEKRGMSEICSYDNLAALHQFAFT